MVAIKSRAPSWDFYTISCITHCASLSIDSNRACFIHRAHQMLIRCSGLVTCLRAYLHRAAVHGPYHVMKAHCVPRAHHMMKAHLVLMAHQIPRAHQTAQGPQ
eukprot:1161743-Pelagomonas_calceolata.AAC.12